MCTPPHFGSATGGLLAVDAGLCKDNTDDFTSAAGSFGSNGDRTEKEGMREGREWGDGGEVERLTKVNSEEEDANE